MKWCCEVFERAYSDAGHRGLAVLIEDGLDDRPLFLLQARAFDGLSEPKIHSTAHINLVTDKAIGFCPWCGVDLDEWYGKTFRERVRPGFRIE